jgi:mRNA interferase RelE/StbE
MRLEIDASALKVLQRMQPKVARAILVRLNEIAADPFASHSNVERMQGRKDAFRLRHGDWRAIYWIDRVAQAMKVERIAPRGEVYK